MHCEKETGAVIRFPSDVNRGCASTGRGESFTHGHPPASAPFTTSLEKVDHEGRLLTLPWRIEGSVAVEHRQRRAVGQRIGKAWESHVEIHPVDTRRSDDQSVRRIEWGVFDGAVYPPNFRAVGVWLVARHLQHRVGRVDGVGTVYMIDEAQRNLSRAASGV